MSDNEKKPSTGKRIVVAATLLWGLLLIVYLVSLAAQDSILLAFIVTPPICFIVLLGIIGFLDFVLG